MRILQTPTFRRTAKRLKANQKQALDKAVRMLMRNPEAGEMKKGDLAGVRVYKFRMQKALTLLAYAHDQDTLTLLALGSHENFYRDLKR